MQKVNPAKSASPSTHNRYNPSDPGRYLAARMHGIQPSLTLAITAQAAAMANGTWKPASA